MRLVKAGRVSKIASARARRRAGAGSRCRRLAGGALLADARDLVLRQAPTGVIWPTIARLPSSLRISTGSRSLPWLFPTFRDGRAYSQARPAARALINFAASCVHGPSLARPTAVSARAGFDAFESTKDADAAAFPRLCTVTACLSADGDGRASR